MADQTVHLDVALALGGDTIRGTVDDGVGPIVEFTGWLDLMSAFDTTRARATGEDGSADAPTARD